MSTELDRWEVDGITFHLMAEEPDEFDDDYMPVATPFFGPEQMRRIWDRYEAGETIRVALIYRGGDDAP